MSTNSSQQCLQVNLLGNSYAILPENGRIQFHADNSLLLMTLIALQPEKIYRRSELASLLYPDHDDQRASQNVRQVIHRLRKLLGDDVRKTPVLLVDSVTIRVNPETSLVSDVAQFTGQFTLTRHLIRQHSHRRLEVCRSCNQKIENLLSMYGGDLLEGYLPDTGGTLDDRIPAMRQELQSDLLWCQKQAAAHYFASGRLDPCAAILGQILQAEPLDEAALRMQMKVLLIQGRRNQALLCYHAFQAELHLQLGIEPDEETILLAEEIRTANRESFQGAGWQPAVQINADSDYMPDASLPFFNRQQETTQILDMLESAEHHVVVIQGVIGSGKTRLAMHAADLDRNAWRDGVHMISLKKAAVQTTGLTTAILRTLGLFSANSSENRTQLLNALRDRECLIILDDLDELPAQADLVRVIVNHCPQVKFLITTRRHLGIRGEKVIHIGGLAYPASYEQGSGMEAQAFVNQYPALQLFRECARREKSDLVIGPDELPPVIQICSMLVGLPLWIELAASYCRLFTCEEIRDGVYACLNGMAGVSNFIADRHGVFRKRFENIWESLDPVERDLVHLVYPHPDGVVTDDLLAANLATIETLVSLQDKSTIIRLPGSRVKLHPLVRLFCKL